MKDYKYMIFRNYLPNEEGYDLGPVFYGWSSNKKIIKAFLQQRGKNKYCCKEMSNYEIEHNNLSKEAENDDKMIKLLLLQSVNDNNIYPFFITDSESKEVEKKIHIYFSDLASFDEYLPDDRKTLITMFLNLKKEAKDILEDIGCVPSDFNDMGYMESENLFPSLYDEIDTLIEEAYTIPTESSFDEEMEYMPKGHYYLIDFHSRYCYSLEAFIKILREDF